MAEPFALEIAPGSSRVPEATLSELLHLRSTAADATKDFTRAIEAQARKYRTSKTALKRFVNAIAAEKVPELAAETKDIAEFLLDR